MRDSRQKKDGRATARPRSKVAISNADLPRKLEKSLADCEALRDSEERLRLATEAAHIYSWVLDLETGKITNSPNAEQVRGSPAPSTLADGLAMVHPDDRERVQVERRRAVDSSGQLDSVYRVVNPQNGEISWMRSQGITVNRDGDVPKRVLGITRNVTAEKNVEAEMIRYREELEQRVRERTAALQYSTDMLKALLDERARLLAQVVENAGRAGQSPAGQRPASSAAARLLTSREEKVVTMVAQGYSNKEMAASLGIGVKTVESHKTRIMQKLELTSRSELVRFAIRQGWLETSPN